MTKKDFIHNLKIQGFILPSLIGVLLFYIAPFFVILYYSVIDNPISKKFVGFQNFIDVFNNEAFKLAAWNTFKFSFTAVPLAVVISLLIAMVLNEKIPLSSRFRTAYLSPMVVPVASIVLVVQVLFDYNGVVNLFVTFFGGDKIDFLKSEHAMLVIILLFLWKNVGYNMILFLSALGTIPRDAIEVALLDTTSEWLIFWKIKIRYLTPTLVFVTILSTINSFKVFREVYLLTGSYPYESIYILQHYMNNMFNSLNYQKLSAAAIIMSVVMIVIILIMYILENNYSGDMEE
ncbi:MAG: sugar ABC transporter permease [Lachnospiraceae bacterium]|nr:sugar ABC transporter permease [Lachnospiraceae bacterium]